jgi:hypothetical protein
MLWMLNLTIFLVGTIMQTIAFAREKPRELSPSDCMTAVQSMLTQTLAVIMTYILTARQHGSSKLHLRQKIWFLIAFSLPIIACITLWYHSGMSGLLTFLGTATIRFLQVVLAVDMKRSKVLP